MSPDAHFIVMDFVTHRFHIYFGDMNDPATWKYQGHSFSMCYDAENKLNELIYPDQP